MEANKYNVEQLNITSLIGLKTPKDGLFDNRIFSYLIISSLGRPINKFKSVREFLEAYRNFIKAYRSLYYDGKILHRDILENNIIVTDAKGKGDPRGMLIDLDLAKELDSGPSGVRHRTGTMEFMAIEVLKDKAHTYRHDLESFFYVFLWIIIRERDKTLPKTSHLRDWYRGTYIQIAKAKSSNMDKKQFEEIIAEFPAEFESLKGLAEELRGILFPIRDGALFTGTYRDPDKLYQPMIEAFKRAIASYRVVNSG
jgi:serine/threonine protein kinase